MKLGVFCSTLVLGLAACSATAHAHQTLFLRTSGTKIVNSRGKAVHLKGVNLGCWLYVEPWMWGTFYFGNFEDGQGETDVLTNYLDAHLTPTQIATFWDTYRTNFITDADIAAIAGKGWNCVRVPIDFRLFVDPATGNPVSSNFKYLDSLVASCRQHGVYAILDMHSVPGSPYAWNAANVFDDAANQALLTTAWLNVASRYAGEPAIAGYDLINEPVPEGDSNFRPFLVQLTQSIRSVDAGHIIFPEGDYWDSALDILGAPWDTNMAFSDHNYGSSLPNNLPHDQDLATGYDVPLWMGEFGYNSNNWVYQQKELLEATNNVNSRSIQSQWTVWSWKANSIWSPMRFSPYGAFQTLLNNLNGDGSTITDAQINSGFMDLANSVAYNSANQNVDVVDSLTRSNWNSATAAYANQRIPGTITNVYFDLGPEGLAYHDSVSSNTGGMGGGFQSWNSGWAMRNDGVDITTYVESGVTKDAVGWNDAGEWQQYTVGVKPGTYTMTVKYSGPGGAFHVIIDGVNVTGTITLPQGPNSGDWGTYGTYTVPGVKISTRGTLKVKVFCDTPGYNLASLSFS